MVKSVARFALLLERIGLKPIPVREKLKSEFSLLQSSDLQVKVADSSVNRQSNYSTLLALLSTVNSPPVLFPSNITAKLYPQLDAFIVTGSRYALGVKIKGSSVTAPVISYTY